jgi:hypothetical protein
MTTVACHFWNPESGAGKLSHSKCEQQAQTFVRIKHTGRLCPLCPSCLGTFESANKSMPEESKQGMPGHGEYEVVSLTDGADEFSKQPPRK